MEGIKSTKSYLLTGVRVKVENQKQTTSHTRVWLNIILSISNLPNNIPYKKLYPSRNLTFLRFQTIDGRRNNR
jgi:hypothetical protein